MPKLINSTAEVDDSWQILALDYASTGTGTGTGTIKPVYPASYWLEHKAEIQGKASNGESFGLWLASDQPPQVIADDLQHLALIAIDFPVFADGRGYSYAKALRKEYNFTGEIRAIGDILIDQLPYLRRCGFDTFALRDDQDISIALQSFEPFSDSYQAELDREALFNRR